MPGSAPKTAENTLSSLALVDTLSFFDDKLLLTGGLRNQRVKTTNFDKTGKTTSRYDKDAVTPAVALVVKPWGPDVSLYANYVQGLSKGDSVTDTTASNYGQVFAPYKTKQKEVGIKWNAGTFTNTLALFQIDPRRDSNLVGMPVGHLFGTHTTRVGVKSGVFLRDYVYTFLEMLAPSLTRAVVTEAVQGAPK